MAWLTQRRPGDDAVLLQDYPAKLVRLNRRDDQVSTRTWLDRLVRWLSIAATLASLALLAAAMVTLICRECWDPRGRLGTTVPAANPTPSPGDELLLDDSFKFPPPAPPVAPRPAAVDPAAPR